MHEKLIELVKEAINELNEQLSDEEKISFSPDLKFIGKNSCVDSFGLVTFMSILEDLIADNFGKTIQIVSEKAFSEKNSPFLSVETLSSYIEKLLNEE